jgi:DNA-binding FadR family transcriptional regulator
MCAAGTAAPVDGTAPEPSDEAARSLGKLAASVARRIEAEVLARGWPVGELLDSEPELRERYGVSRTVLREAARLVEHHQVARMRRGPGGGLIIAAPDAEPAIRAVVSYLEFIGADAGHVLQARALLEPVSAALAADRLTEEGVVVLRRVLDAERGHAGAAEGWFDNPLHVELSRLSGNPVLELFVDLLDRLTRRYVHVRRQTPADEIARVMAGSHRWHTEIVEAVIAGESARAQVRLLEHLDEITAWLGTRDALRRGSAAGPAPGSAYTATRLPSATMAEAVAARIYDDIMRRGWPVGLSLGSESELMDRYGAGRAVLRAAVRLLEHHSIARPRRGRIGGLVVTSPDPQASVEATALYLAYRGVTASHLHAVRDVVELGAVAAAARTRGSGGPGPDPEAALPFHLAITGLAGNPVLDLLVRIVVDVADRDPATSAAPPEHDAAGAVADAHRAILDAVVAGDASLARHRLRRHLDQGVRCWP